VGLEQLTIERMLGTQEEAIAYCTKQDTQIAKPRMFGLSVKYTGSDLNIFNKKDIWYPWQIVVFKLLFESQITDKRYFVREPDDRSIIWITDTKGNSGKSKFVKNICYKMPDECCKLTFGSSAQLRSACISAGPRQIYFIDLPRTMGRDDDINDIISVIEDIKNGFVVSSMYGKHQQLMFEPPHIVVFANVFCPKDTLSEDRLKSYEINYYKDFEVP